MSSFIQFFPLLLNVLIIKKDETVFYNQRIAVSSSGRLANICVKHVIAWECTAGGITQRRDYPLSSTAAIVSPRDTSCLIDDFTLLLVNNNPGGHIFQIWDLPQDGPASLKCFAESTGKTEIAFTIAHGSHFVVTATQEGLHIWDVTQKGY